MSCQVGFRGMIKSRDRQYEICYLCHAMRRPVDTVFSVCRSKRISEASADYMQTTPFHARHSSSTAWKVPAGRTTRVTCTA